MDKLAKYGSVGDKANHIWSGLSENLGLDVSIFLMLTSDKVNFTFIAIIEVWTQNVTMPRGAVSLNGRLDPEMILRFIERAYLTDVMLSKPSNERLH